MAWTYATRDGDVYATSTYSDACTTADSTHSSNIFNTNYYDETTTASTGCYEVHNYFNGIIRHIEIRDIPDSLPPPPLHPSQCLPELPKYKRKLGSKPEKLARALLLKHLNRDNRKRYFNDEPIEIISKIFDDIVYKIHLRKHAQICAHNREDIVVDELCVEVDETEILPVDDVVLTKLLHVLYNEENMLKTAVHTSNIDDLLIRMN